MGTPTEAYNTEGKKVWERELDIFGRVRKENLTNFVPWLYQGQYVDTETGLAYNRFRYYDPSIGSYISQDPIGLEGNNPTIYGYVHDSNNWVDIFGESEKLPKDGRYHGSKPKYENPGHHDTANPGRFRGGGTEKTSILPKNAEDIYKSAIPDSKGKNWYSMDSNGEIHRFMGSDGKAHWAGSSKQGRGIKVPPEVNKRFNNNQYRVAPAANYH